MGIIIKESFNQSAVKLALAVVGAIATIFIYPQNLELNGIFGFVIDAGAFFVPFILVGLGHSSIRFFYDNNDSKTHRISFLKSLLRLLLINVLIFGAILYFGKERILGLSSNPSENFSEYFIYLIPSGILFTINHFLTKYLSNYKKVTIPIFLQNLYKLIVPIVFLMVLIFNLGIIHGIWLILGSLLLSAIVMLIMVFRNLSRVRLTNFSKGREVTNSEFYNYYFWAFATSAGAVMAFRLDGIMIPSLMDFSSAGEYRIGLFIAAIIAIPMQSVLSISAPIVSESWKMNDIDELKSVYLQGSRNLLFIGGALLLAMLILVQILPWFFDTWKDMDLIAFLVVIIGVTKLFDMFSSTNSLIIQYSPWFRYNTYVVLILMFSNVILNYMLITRYGIIGAAIATGISIFISNNLRTLLLYFKLNIHPFTVKSVLFFFLTSAICCLSLWVNHSYGTLSSIVLTSVVSAIFLFSFLYVLELAPETRKVVKQIWEKLSSGS